MAAKGGFSIADLQQGAKKLQTAEAPPADCKGAKSSVAAVDNEALLSLESLYERMNGNLDEIFAELKSDPSKAKKPHHRPKDAKEFAQKYLQGFYSVIDTELDSAADSKSSHK